jgi:alpha-tubulin suppressor-like RCC1 family protein
VGGKTGPSRPYTSASWQRLWRSRPARLVVPALLALTVLGPLTELPASASSISGLSVTIGNPQVGQQSQYSISFTTSTSGTLAPATGTISVQAAPGTQFSSTAQYTFTADGQPEGYSAATHATAGSSTQNEFVLTVEVGVVPADATVNITTSGTNSTRAGQTQLTVSTSSDTIPVSKAYSLTPGPPSELGFVQQPSNTVAGQTMSPPVAVQVEDAYGNATADNGVTVTLGSNPSATVSGNSAPTNASGLATFSNVVMTAPGSYTLTASTTGLSSAISAQFAIWASVAPNPPTSVSAVAGNGRTTLYWAPPTANGGPPVLSYTVTASPGGFSQTLGSSASSLTIPNLTPGVVYTVGVYATNSVGSGNSQSTTSVPDYFPSTLAAGASYDMVVRQNDGSVWSWGDNTYGELGTGSTSSSPVASPAETASLGSVTSVAAGGDHSLALTSGGNVWAWGANSSGQLGNGTTSPSSTPVEVKNSAGSGPLTNIVAIAAGGSFSMALQSNGAVWTWGYNNDGELGNNSQTPSSLPVSPTALSSVSAIAAGSKFALAVKSGNVWAWGAGSNGQLGDALNQNSSIPVTVIESPTAGGGTLSGVTAVAAGGVHALALASGTVWSWGDNTYGELGNGSTSSSPQNTAVKVSNLSDAAAIAAGQYHTLALTSSNQVLGWGLNSSGQLGDGNDSNSDVPVTVPNLTASVIAAGGNHSAAIRTDNTVTGSAVWTWGDDALGELGTGTTGSSGDSNTPVAAEWMPGAPTAVTAVPGPGTATVNWSAPGYNGNAALTPYTITASPGGQTATAPGSSTSGSISGLPYGSYTFTVTAANVVGNGPTSAPSSAVVLPTVPGAPTSVTATAGNSSASVSWTAPSYNGESSITSYVVTASPGGEQATAPSGQTYTTLTGLAPGTSYTFTVFATNAEGNGTASAPSNAVVPYTFPGAPTSVSAAAGSSSATVTWAAPSSNGYSAITSYTVVASPGGPQATVQYPATTATVSALTPGTSYTFTVLATNAAGNGPASAPSNAVVPYTTPGAPASVSATASLLSVTVTWGAPSSNGYSTISSYTVTASPGGASSTVGGTTTTATFNNLVGGTTYTFSVYASNAAGNGPASNSPAVNLVPGAPTGVTANFGSSSASVSWNAPANGGIPISSYSVYASQNGVGGGGPVAVVSGSTTQVNLPGLSNNGYSYRIVVFAANAYGTGPGSTAGPVYNNGQGSTVQPQSYWTAWANGVVDAYGPNAGANAGAGSSTDIVGVAADQHLAGDNYYWLAAADGTVTGTDPYEQGGVPGAQSHLGGAVVGITPAYTTDGYWLVTANGVVCGFGVNAVSGSTSYGSSYGNVYNGSCVEEFPTLTTVSDIVGIAAYPDGSDDGYWLVDVNGNVYPFGTAPSYGSGAAGEVVGIAAAPNGKGYWLAQQNGAVWAYGVSWYGDDSGAALPYNISAIASTLDGKGYWLLGGDGSIYSFGDAAYLGSPEVNSFYYPAVGLAEIP